MSGIVHCGEQGKDMLQSCQGLLILYNVPDNQVQGYVSPLGDCLSHTRRGFTSWHSVLPLEHHNESILELNPKLFWVYGKSPSRKLVDYSQP